MSTLKVGRVQNTSGVDSLILESNGTMNIQRLKLPIFNGTPASPIQGEVIYNSLTGKISFYDGTAWK